MEGIQEEWLGWKIVNKQVTVADPASVSWPVASRAYVGQTGGAAVASLYQMTWPTRDRRVQSFWNWLASYEGLSPAMVECLTKEGFDFSIYL
jgi:hypothetical protein